jgi:hypothetical protein
MINSRVVALQMLLLAALGGCQAGAPINVEAESVRVHAVVAKGTVKPAGVPADFVATPVGFFHPSCLIHVDAKQPLGARAASACAYPHYDVTGKAILPSLAPQNVTNDIEGWSLADNSSYMPGVSKLSARWTVPPTPAQSGQVLFFFPGTQSLDGKSGGTILQPVLAYENSQWFVQSWNCCEGGGNAEFGDAVNVAPGDTIVGTNTGSNCNSATGICNNWRIVTSDISNGGASTFDTLSFGHPHQWIFANVLEVYSLKSCDQLPTTGGVTYHDFAIWDLRGNPIDVTGLSWRDDVDQQLAGCGTTWGGSQSGTDFTVTWGGSRGGGGGGNVHLVAPFSGKCLDVSGSGTSDGTKIQEWSCNGTSAQAFHLADAGNGAVSIVNNNSGKCIDIDHSGTADGTKAQLWTCNGSGAQSFDQLDAGGGNVKLVNTNSGKCLDVNGGSSTDGTQVQLWTCNGSGAQSWQIQRF